MLGDRLPRALRGWAAELGEMRNFGLLEVEVVGGTTKLFEGLRGGGVPFLLRPL